MNLPPFRIEKFYEEYEFSTEFMLSSSDAESWSLGRILDMEPGSDKEFFNLRLGYTEVRGSPALRTELNKIYTEGGVDDVLVCACAEEAIFLVYHALVGPGDHVVVEAPCYESALALARSTGAEVSTWDRRYGEGWRHDLTNLRKLIRPNTKLIYINSPHNPTGLSMSRDVFDEVIEICRDTGAFLFSDEVYRELEHRPELQLPAAADRLTNAISLGSLSKAYGLPGLRLGWLRCRNPDVLRKVADLKHYTTICSSAASEFLATVAMRHRKRLVERNRKLVEKNLGFLTKFIDESAGLFAWQPPNAGTIGFPRVDDPDVEGWCIDLAQKAGVLLLPGTVYDQPSHVRLGYGRENFPLALKRLEAYLAVSL